MSLSPIPSLNSISGLFEYGYNLGGEVFSRIASRYSPWVFEEEITLKAQSGDSKGLESRYIIDLSQYLYRKIAFLSETFFRSCERCMLLRTRN